MDFVEIYPRLSFDEITNKFEKIFGRPRPRRRKTGRFKFGYYFKPGITVWKDNSEYKRKRHQVRLDAKATTPEILVILDAVLHPEIDPKKIQGDWQRWKTQCEEERGDRYCESDLPDFLGIKGKRLYAGISKGEISVDLEFKNESQAQQVKNKLSEMKRLKNGRRVNTSCKSTTYQGTKSDKRKTTDYVRKERSKIADSGPVVAMQLQLGLKHFRNQGIENLRDLAERVESDKLMDLYNPHVRFCEYNMEQLSWHLAKVLARGTYPNKFKGRINYDKLEYNVWSKDPEQEKANSLVFAKCYVDTTLEFFIGRFGSSASVINAYIFWFNNSDLPLPPRYPESDSYSIPLNRLIEVWRKTPYLYGDNWVLTDDQCFKLISLLDKSEDLAREYMGNLGFPWKPRKIKPNRGRTDWLKKYTLTELLNYPH